MSEHHAGEGNPDPRDAGARREGASASPLDTVAADSARPTESTVRIGLVLPDVMGTYGDGGNAVVLRQRLRLRGIDADIVEMALFSRAPFLAGRLLNTTSAMAKHPST